MNIDLPGRIRNTKLPHSHGLSPVFEAIINSIHAIAETANPRQGQIWINIQRDHSQQSLPSDGVGKALGPVRSFTIQDSGIGFDDVHYNAFETSDTRQKANQGGKGVGRFLWLKAFDHAEVESIFRAVDGKLFHRSFELRLTDNGVENHSLVPVANGKEGSTVRLVNFRPEYQDEAPRSAETIAKRIVEHCVEHFVLGLAPAIVVHDDDTDEDINLNELFAADVSLTSGSSNFTVNGRKFYIHNLRVSPSYQSSHRLHFCAHNRAVLPEALLGRVPNVVGTLEGEDGRHFMYAGYVSGQYLDEYVNSERTDFTMPDQDSVVGEPCWTSIVNAAVENAAAFLAPYTESLRKAKEEQITVYVQAKAPQYRPVVKHRKDLLDRVSPNLPDEKLDLELYKINQTYEAELRQKSSNLLSSLESGPTDWVIFEKQYQEFLEEWNEAGIAKLARHIVHRKATLEFMKASLKVQATGKYRLETAVHRIIFPLKKSSDDVRPDQMNLWIIDEKLAYHYYLASDIRLKDQPVIQSDSEDRGDIVIFNGPAAFVNDAPPFSSVVLIEFKRPGRNDYSDSENPIAQIYRYVTRIKDGKAVDRQGRPINIKKDTPFYAYIISDITPKLREQAAFAKLIPSPDALGFVGYNDQVGVYVELLSFDKLVGDAERRNASLFEQLNIPANLAAASTAS